MFCGKIEVLVQYSEVLTVISRNHLVTFPELRLALRQVIGTDVDTITIHVPAVAVLRRRIKRVKSGVKFSKLSVAQRDNFHCQYCGVRLPLSRLNYDHVIPRDQGGKTVWSNIVMSCYPCNSHKANRTPEEAGMRLLKQPHKPKELPMASLVVDPAKAPEEWLPFLSVA